MEPAQEAPIQSPYEVGAKFHLCVSPSTGSSYEVHATVVAAFVPFTISPVMRVSLGTVMPSESDNAQLPVDLPSEMILKVYDRRFAHSLREYYKGKPATYESEAQYQQYLASGPAADPDELDEQISEATPTAGYEGCPPHLFEHLITFAMSPYYENECAAYERLASLQGRDIPRFYGSVKVLDLDVDPPVEGVLLEVVPGTSLDNADPALVDIDAAVRGAMRIIDSYYDLGLLNEDVHLGNFIVKPDGSVVMIDFAQSRLREEDESDEDWREAKEGADEEGCIGFKAKKKFGWPWVRGKKYYSRLTESDGEEESDENGSAGRSTPGESGSDAMEPVEEVSRPNGDGETQLDGASEMLDQMANGASAETIGGPPIPPEPDSVHVTAEEALGNESGGASTPVEDESNGVDLLDEPNQPIGFHQSNGQSQSGLAGDLEPTGDQGGAREPQGKVEPSGVAGQTTNPTSMGTVKSTLILYPSYVGLKMSLVPHLYEICAAISGQKGESDGADQLSRID